MENMKEAKNNRIKMFKKFSVLREFAEIRRISNILKKMKIEKSKQHVVK